MGTIIKSLMGFLPQADILYVLAFVALGGWAAYEVHHLESIGAAKQVAADKKLADEVKAHNTDLQNAATTLAAAIEAQYEKDLNTLSSPAPHVLCNRVAPRSNQLSAAPGGLGSSGEGAQPGVQPADDGGGDSVDIGPPLTLAGHKADVTIETLQRDVQNLLNEMTGANKNAGR